MSILLAIPYRRA